MLITGIFLLLLVVNAFVTTIYTVFSFKERLHININSIIGVTCKLYMMILITMFFFPS